MNKHEKRIIQALGVIFLEGLMILWERYRGLKEEKSPNTKLAQVRPIRRIPKRGSGAESRHRDAWDRSLRLAERGMELSREHGGL